MLKNIFLYSIILLFFTALTFSFLYYKNSDIVANVASVDTALRAPKTFTVTLTERGFEPVVLIVRKNDTVSFSTTRTDIFWPASNIHPTHSIYPAFDPLKEIESDQTWEFTFTEVGQYRYHDHIAANFTGLIVVTEENGETDYDPTTHVNDCTDIENVQQKQGCWDQQLEVVLKLNGLDAAFDYFIDLYNTEPETPKNCHGWGHSLGKTAYEEYKEGNEITLRPETSYCGYGFYHGFIEELLKDTGQIQDTLEFCSFVEKELDGIIDGARSNCVHGVGHGATAMLVERPENWGKDLEIIQVATGLCEQTYTEDRDLEDCYDGVFNETQNVLFGNEYGQDLDLFLEKGGPFWLCDLVEERHQKSCYYEYSGMFWYVFDINLSDAVQFALDTVPRLEELGAKVAARIVADFIQIDIVKDSFEKYVDVCRDVPEFLQTDCFVGILNGFASHGEPGKMHVKGYSFCADEYLTEDERTMCYYDLTRLLEWSYTKEEFIESCKYIQPIKDDIVRCQQVLNQ